MSRPAGVTVSAVFLILVSLFTALMGAVMLMARSFVPATTPQPPFFTALMYVSVGMFFAFALWGVLSSVGLFRMRPWARLSILVIGALLAILFGIMVAIFYFVAQQTPELDATGRANSILSLVVGIYLLPVLVGIWWVVYFNLAKVKRAFLEGVPAATGPVRPLSITVIAWHLVAAGLLAPMLLWIRFPALFLGVFLTGWAAMLLYCVYAVVELFIGIGLLRLKPWSLTAAVWFFVFGMLNSVVFFFVPNLSEKLYAAMQTMMPDTYGSSGVAELPSPLLNATLGVLMMALPLFYLVTRKQAFLEAGRRNENTT